ncbi:hypothetical protein F4805DRAFT_199276 [Annulohypoxylon moriforme]|nr:hypothetical protein F4805DRAFT_199276 [Annulohypoxylon moriforme]
MKNTRSACLLCRHIAAAKGGARTYPWHLQMSQFSTTPPSKSDDLASLALGLNSTKSNHHGSDSVDNTEEKKTPVRRVMRPDERDAIIRWKYETKAKQKEKSKRDEARVDALFQQIVHQQENSRSESEEMLMGGTSKKNLVKLALFKAIKDLGELERMLEKDEPAAKVFTYFKTTILPTLEQLDMVVPKVYRVTVKRMVEWLYIAKAEAIRSPELPPVSEMLLTLTKVDNVSPRKWAKLVGRLVEELVKIDTSAESSDSSANFSGSITRHAMLSDLIECWKILSLPNAARRNSENEVLEGFWFPRLDKWSIAKCSESGNWPEAFSRAFPHFRREQLGEPIAILAIATYALLVDPRRTSPELRRRATRLISRVAYLITYIPYNPTALKGHASKYYPELVGYVTTQWAIARKTLREKVENIDKPEPPPQPSNNPDDINERTLTYHLHLTITARNTKEVDKRWRAFTQTQLYGQEISQERAKELKKYPDIFDLFIYTRMALNEPEKALNVLKVIRSIGLKPTLKTWNVMLDGCKKAHNLNGIRNVWAKLIASGMKLDMRLWTTRISGLVECGDCDGAIEALREMSRLWTQSSRDENAMAVKPTIEPVNAVFAGLLRQNKVKEAEKLLGWADRHGLEPDIFTYNPLLRRYIQEGRLSAVRDLFDTMKERGITADAATFTILIDAAFSQVAPDDTEGEARAVTMALEGIEKAGLEPNLQNYGKIMYNLLQGSNTTRNAVKHVLSHLWERGFELTPHIYTMLVDFFFSQEPPDIQGVHSLIERRRFLDFDDRDVVFYDRVILGYTRVKLSQRALSHYYKLSRTGVLVPISTQVKLLHGLLLEDREGDARDMVENTLSIYIKRHNEGSVEGAEFWDHLFWRLAAAHGLLELDKLPVGKQ